MTINSTAPVTVIIPTFNRANFIAEAIDSIINQTTPPEQIIISDDGSTDHTASVVGQYGDQVTYVRNENAGKSAAINRITPLIRGKFVWIFDDDDFAYPDAIQTHMDIHGKNPGLGFTFGSHIWGRSGVDGRIIETQTTSIPAIFTAPLAEQRINLLRYCAVMLSGCIVKRDCLEAMLPFREDLHRSQDYEMLLRLSQAFDFAYVGKPSYILRKHDGIRGPAVSQHSSKDRNRIWRKYDQIIGKSLYVSVPLERYLLASEVQLLGKDRWERAALIRRAWVMASKACIEEGIDDLITACEIAPTRSDLSDLEVSCCSSLGDHPYFLMRALEEPECLSKLRILRSRLIGRQILECVGKGFYWKAIERDSELEIFDRIRLLKKAIFLKLIGRP